MVFGLSAGGIPFNPEGDIPDLSDKVLLITGGNVGLGYESTLQLSKHNPSKIYLAARTQSKAEEAIKNIQTVVPNAKVAFIQCDLTSLESVQSCAREFVSKEQRLDILLLNAGIMATPAGTTREGYEIQFGTNHVGHALLTKLLIPTLLKTAEKPSADVRVVSVSSMGHMAARGMPFDDLKTDMNSYLTWTRYANSKLANILFTKEIARRYPSITAVAVHPGVVNSELYRSVYKSFWAFSGISKFALSFIFITVPEGSKNQLWASVAKKGEATGEVKSGEYYIPVGVSGRGSGLSSNAELAEKLWTWTENELESWNL